MEGQHNLRRNRLHKKNLAEVQAVVRVSQCKRTERWDELQPACTDRRLPETEMVVPHRPLPDGQPK